MAASLERKEPTPVEMTKVAVHLEGCNERRSRRRSNDPSTDVAVRCRQQPKKWIQGDDVSRKNLVSARRRMTCRSVFARRKGLSHKGPTVEKRWRKGPECSNGIRDRDLNSGYVWEARDIWGPRTNSRVGDCKESSRILHRVAESEWLDHVKRWAPSETKEETSKALPSEKKYDGSKHGSARTLTGNRSGHAVLRREQREQLQSNHRENWATWKEGKTDHRCHKHSPR
jgi:hypothetical protein